MPRARRRCSKVVGGVPCKHFQPCAIKEHRRGWDASKSEGMPTDWRARVRFVKVRSGGRCEVHHRIGPVRQRCKRPMVEVDHIINRAKWPKGKPGLHEVRPRWDDPKNNLQAICDTCHRMKTNVEKKGGTWSP